MIVGHLDETLKYNYDGTPYSSLNFCVRELVINGQVQDFSNPLDAVNVSPSCEENQCNSDACKNGGRCIGTQSSFTCVCPVEYAGATCNESKFTPYHSINHQSSTYFSIDAGSATFSGDSFIQYTVIESSLRKRVARQTDTYTTGRNNVLLALITRSDTGTILQIGLEEEDNFAILEVKQDTILNSVWYALANYAFLSLSFRLLMVIFSFGSTWGQGLQQLHKQQCKSMMTGVIL